MKKNLFKLCIALVAMATFFVGCDKDDEESAAEQQISETSNEDFAIINDNIKVANYKGLSVDGYDDTVTEDDINSFIDYVMQSVYTPKTEDSDTDNEENNNTDEPVLTYKDLTDEIASQVSDGKYTTVADYREYVKGLIKDQNKSYFIDNAKAQLFAQVVEKSELVNYSEADLKNYIDYANEYYAEYAEYLGVDLETFRKDTMNFQTEDEFTNFVQEEALSNLKTEYVIRAIAEKEGIDVSDEEINSEIKNYIDNGYFSTEEEVLNYTTRDEIITNKKYYKIMDIIFENANITPFVVKDDSANEEQASSDIIPLTEDNTY